MIKIFCISLSLALALSACVQTESSKKLTRENLSLQSGLEKKINAPLNEKTYSGVRTCILIRSLKSHSIIFEREADVPCMTASVFKIVVSGIALTKYGAGHVFETSVFFDKKPGDGVVQGDIYLKGGGDSTLSTSDLKKIVDKIWTAGIRSISGNLIYDASLFDEEKNRYGNNARNLYTPASALTVDYGWIDVAIRNGEKVELKLIPETSYARLTYDVKLSPQDVWGRPVMTYIPRPWGDEFSIKGTIAAKDIQYHYVCLGTSRPALYAATIFKELLAKKGIQISGKILQGLTPKNTPAFLAFKLKPLKEIVTIMNQESNNVIAEMLNKSLGADFGSVPGTREKGLDIIQNYLIKELGYKKGSFSVGDASGLSISNRLSARQVCGILEHYYSNPKVRDAFIPTLALQGHHPHAATPIPPDTMKIYVKTGTLSVEGVNTVAGYIFTDSGKNVYSFAILANRLKPGPMTYSGTLTNPLLSAIINSFKENMDKADKPFR